MNDRAHAEALRQRQENAQQRLADAVTGKRDIAEIKIILDDIDTLNRAAIAFPSSKDHGIILKLIAVGFLICATAALGFAIRLSPGRVTVDAIVTDFDAKTAGGKDADAPKLASSVQLVPGSLAVSGATVNRRAYSLADAAELAKMIALTEFGALSSSTYVRISTPQIKCYEIMVLQGEWRATASRTDKGSAAAIEISLPKNSEISFCTPEGIRLSIFGITWLGLHRPFADTIPPTFATSIISGTLQRERVSGDRKLTASERVELTGITSGAVELRNDDRLKLSFSGNAERLCALQGIGSALNGTCDDDLRPTIFDFVRQNALLAQILVAIAGIAGFAGTIARFFRWRIPGITALFLAITLQLGDVKPAAAQDARPFILNNLVRLTVRLADGGVREGYGLVIGRKGDDIWIVTAAHVVINDDGKSFPAPSVSAIIGPAECQTPATASDQAYKPGRTDIALMPLRVPLKMQTQRPAQGLPPQSSACELWITGILSSSPVAGEELKLIGHGGQLEINPRAVRLTGSVSAAGPEGSVGIEGLSTKEGDSGAPVASARGVVGLYVGALADSGYMVPINTVREAISGLDVPWQLMTGSDPSPGSVRFCIQQTGPERPEIRLQGPTDAVRLDAAGCAIGPRATLRVNVPDPALYTCDPGRIAPAKDNQTIIIACSAKLDGYWRYGATDGLTVSAINSRRWRINGLGTTPAGFLTGEVQGTSAEAVGLINSSSDSSVQLSVTLRGSIKTLQVSVQTPSMQRTFDLTR